MLSAKIFTPHAERCVKEKNIRPQSLELYIVLLYIIIFTDRDVVERYCGLGNQLIPTTQNVQTMQTRFQKIFYHFQEQDLSWVRIARLTSCLLMKKKKTMSLKIQL